MAHIHQNAQSLAFLDIFPAPPGQTASGYMGTGQRVIFIPAQCGNTKAQIVQFFELCRIKANSRGAFQREDGGDDALLQISAHLVCAAGLPDHILIPVNLILQDTHFPPEHIFHLDALGQRKIGGRPKRKALCIAGVLLHTLQIDMELIAAQRCTGGKVLSKQFGHRIAVQVKNRYIHWNASSK